jgi:hypothetical protein
MKAAKIFPPTTIQTHEMAGVDILEMDAMRISNRYGQP